MCFDYMKKNQMNKLWKFEQNRTISSKVMKFWILNNITIPTAMVIRALRNVGKICDVLSDNSSFTLYTKFHISFFLSEMTTKCCFSAWVWHAFIDSACILERTMLKYLSKLEKGKEIWNFVYRVNEDWSTNTSHTF